MAADKSFLMQKQVRDNADDLQTEFLDMKNWENQMRQKDQQLLQQNKHEEMLPPIRSKKKVKAKVNGQQSKESTAKSKRIRSCDYQSWEKFDADKICENMDKENQSDESVEEPLSKEELEKSHAEAVKHKEQGNVCVQQQKWTEAIACYNQAIKIFPYDAVFYANRALCHLKIDNLYSAESDCSAALQLDETYVKAYHRRATARMSLKQYKEAKQDLEKILKLEPSNKEANILLAKVNKIINDSKPVIISGEDLSDDNVSIEKKIGEKMFMTEKEKRNSDKSKEIGKARVTKQTIEKSAWIPDWLPEKDNVTIVEPIVKPPHLRSKDPLKKIPVQEVAFEIAKYKNLVVEETSSIEQCTASSKNVEKKDTSGEEIISIISSSSKTSMDSTETAITPMVPRTAVQFLLAWKGNKSLEFRYNYLKQLENGSLPRIFQDSMESDIFDEILVVLQSEFVSRETPVFQFLQDLSQIKRFKALIMFISSSTKEGLKTLFEYCKTVESKTEDEVSTLRHAYEI